MPNTLPEGFTPPPFITERAMEGVRPEPPRDPMVGSRSFVVAISTILGILVTCGLIIGVLGQAFFVARTEYTTQNLRAAEDKVSVSEAIKRIDLSVARQEAALDKLSSSLDAVRADYARWRK